jgi:hypothetical protein
VSRTLSAAVDAALGARPATGETWRGHLVSSPHAEERPDVLAALRAHYVYAVASEGTHATALSLKRPCVTPALGARAAQRLGDR